MRANPVSTSAPTTRLYKIAIAAIFALIACETTGGVPQVTPREVELPVGEYFGAIWLTDDVLVVGTRAEVESRLVVVETDSGVERTVSPGDLDASKGRCVGGGDDYLVLGALPDGRVGLLRVCPGPISRSTLLAVDLMAEATEDLVPLPDVPTDYTWNPDMTEGFFSAGSGICQGMARMSRGVGAVAAEIFVGEGESRFRVDDYFRASQVGDCNDQGRAMLPAWSPDGEVITFFAVPAERGVSNFGRLDSRWSLYLMSADELVPQRLLAGVRIPSGSVWSPDSNHLAFSGEIDGRDGVWLYERATGALSLLALGPFSLGSWSPDGSRLVAIDRNPDAIESTNVVILALDE